MKIKIVVPVYNAQEWITDCIESILAQKYKNFECICIDDASTDSTKKILSKINLDERFTIIHNEYNKGALSNTVMGFDVLKSKDEPESILIVVDGDDKLANENVFNIILKAYSIKKDCLLTYGNYIDFPSGSPGICKKFPDEVISSRSYREFPYVSSHLRTFKSKLWYKLDKSCLIDPNTNEYFKVTGDLAHMIPLLEMAGDRFIFIPQILYLYNRINPISDGYIKLKEQWSVDQYVRTLPKHSEVIFE
jgi:glycosyltransferase involved in cell wall biosynthesis